MDKTNSIMQIDKNEIKVWKNSKGQYHREDGPAFKYANGTKYWFINGLTHRLDGPAIVYVDGNKTWWLLNKLLTKKEFNSWILRVRKCV